MQTYICVNQKEAKKKLKELFKNFIISDIYTADQQGEKTYNIIYLTPEEFYQNAVDQQKSMKKYLKFLFDKFD